MSLLPERMTSSFPPTPPAPPTDPARGGWSARGRAAAEWLLIFAVFFAEGAVPVPAVNEPYYLGKAIHYWNPDWVGGDFFLESTDAHQVFYFTFGWLARWLAPEPLAWTGRLLSWALLAWAWGRLSRAVVPRPWWSVVTAALFLTLSDHCSMAGEWVVGGVEAKGFAYVLVFLAIEAMLRDRWNRVWPLLGLATSLHVLVGGWSVVAAGGAWWLMPRRPSLSRMIPALAAGLALALPGLIPVLWLNHGAAPEAVAQANVIYVFERLSHHLVLTSFPPALIARFAALTAAWFVLAKVARRAAAAWRPLEGFVAGALAIAVAGGLLGLLEGIDRATAAALLRFYWFRLADVAVPLGVALMGTGLVARWKSGEGSGWIGNRGAAFARFATALVVLPGAAHVALEAAARCVPCPPPAFRLSADPDDYVCWRMACEWIAESGCVSRDARFLTPRMTQTFKWYAQRAEVANWKEVPQDAPAIVEWWSRMRRLHTGAAVSPTTRWNDDLAAAGARRMVELGRQYDAQYAIAPRRRGRAPLDLPVVYRNRAWAIYRLADDHAAQDRLGHDRLDNDRTVDDRTSIAPAANDPAAGNTEPAEGPSDAAPPSASHRRRGDRRSIVRYE